MRLKVGLIKLAAIGDVTQACRALVEFTRTYSVDLELHWIIDSRLQAFAEKLLQLLVASGPAIKVTWETVDSSRLFQGTRKEKVQTAADIFRNAFRARTDCMVVLHRDWRYKALLYPIYRKRLYMVSREFCHELDAYSACLNRIAAQRGLKARSHVPVEQKMPPIESGEVGILIGGAENQKLIYREKRWPHVQALIMSLLENTHYKIVLFGGPGDTNVSRQLVNKLPSDSRIVDLVGKLKLADLPDRLARLDGFVSIDSGPAHIAAAVMRGKHQRVIALYGPTDPQVWGPKASGEATLHVMYTRASCAPCYLNDGVFRPCRFEGHQFQHCMSAISPDDVLSALVSPSRNS